MISLWGFLTLFQTSPDFYVPAIEFFENALGKGEIARNEQFLFFPEVISIRLENFLLVSSNSKLSSVNCFTFVESKICSHSGKGLLSYK